jgi:hypothetical protein
VAVDGKGELIALSADGQADSGGEQPGEAGQQIDPPFRLGIAGRDPGAYYLCIQFAQALRFGEGSCGKLEQTPILRLLPSSGDDSPIQAGEAIVLAIVEVDTAGVATVRDRAEALPHRRQLVGQWGSELLIRRADTAAEAVADAPAARIGARDGGGLRFSVADAADAIILDREDGGQFSRLEVQADEARLPATSKCWAASGWRAGVSRRADRRPTPPSTCSRSRTKSRSGWSRTMAATCPFRFGHRVRAMAMRSILPRPVAESASARLRPIAPSRWSAGARQR